MKTSRFNFTTRTWFQLCMLPALAVVSVGIGWSVYEGMRTTILRGFERKLSAASTTTAAFVNPQDHDQLMERPSIVGLTYRADDDSYYAIDEQRDELVTVQANGAAHRTVPLTNGVHGLAYDAATQGLFTLAPGGQQLLELDPASGAVRKTIELGVVARGLTQGAGDGVIFVISKRLLRVDLRTGAVTPVGSVDLPKFTALAYDPEKQQLWAFATALRRFYRIDTATGLARPDFKLAEDARVPSDITFDSRHKHLVGGSNSFFVIHPENGSTVATSFVSVFGRELTSLYRDYMPPMRRITSDLELTYLYTETVADRSKITYGLDATQGANHSALQADDVLPEEEIAGVQELLRTGALHHTQIRKWQQWGFLKSTFAPIFSPTGQVIALAGADVEVSKIESQTRAALLTIFVVGVASLLGASAASLFIARQLRRPFEAITTLALEVAAGRYQARLNLQNPTELRELSEAFNMATSSLETSMQTLNSSIRTLLNARNQHELVRTLAQRHRPDHALENLPGVRARWLTTNTAGLSIEPLNDYGEAMNSADGAFCSKQRAVIWFATSPSDAVTSLQLRSDLALRYAARLQSTAGETDANRRLAPFLQLPDAVRAAVLIDAAQRTAHIVAHDLISFSAIPDGPRHRISDRHLELQLENFTVTASTP